MGWRDNIGDVMRTVSRAGLESFPEVVDDTAPAPTNTNATLEDQLANQPGLWQMLQDKESWLNQKFSDYLGSVQGATGQYGDVIGSLMKDMQTPVSLGIGGQNMSFIPTSRAGAAQNMAGLQRENTMMAPSQQWAWQQQNPQGIANMQFYDAIASLFGQGEGLRYQVPATTTVTPPGESWMTTAQNALNLFKPAREAYDYFSK